MKPKHQNRDRKKQKGWKNFFSEGKIWCIAVVDFQAENNLLPVKGNK